MHFLGVVSYRMNHLGCISFMFLQKRWMTKSRRVQDRSKRKRVHDLEIVTERWKVASKILLVMDVLKREPDNCLPLSQMEQYKQKLSLSKPHIVADFIRKSPKLFEFFRDMKGIQWCGFTDQAKDLVKEEARLIENHQEKATECLTRMLMMSVNKRLSLDKITHVRRDIGLPHNFRDHWVHKFPKHFRQVKIDGIEHLELVSWNPDWAVTELEKRMHSEIVSEPLIPGILSLPFPLKFPPHFKKISHLGGKLDQFQKGNYLSPYADARRDLMIPGSEEFDKRAVAVMHELLSFTIEKRLVTDHLTHFRREFIMPQRLMRLLLKHFGIFYVSERGRRFHVFLTNAYEGSELIVKSPLVLWKEKILKLTSYREKKRGVRYFDEMYNPEGHDEIKFKDLGIEELLMDNAFALDDAEMKVEKNVDT